MRQYRDYLARTAGMTQRQLDVLSPKGKEGRRMKAMVLEKISPVEEKPLRLVDLPQPVPGRGQILVRVSACGVCHTELDEIEGRVSPSRFPMILGHEVIGRVERFGTGGEKIQKRR